MKPQILRILAHRRWRWVVAAISLVLTLPALGAGMLGDDWIHRCVILGAGPLPASHRPVWDLFAFVTDHAPHTRAWRAAGLVPWWADPNLRIALLRPLSAATHLLDNHVWPDVLVLHHLHSLAWFTAGVAMVAAIYRRASGDAASAGLAALLFSVEDAHAMPAAWLANRNALVSLVFGALSVWLHLRARQTGSRRDLVLSLCALAAGLGAGEAALGAVAYILAWEMTLGPSLWRSRLLTLLPYACLIAAWRVVYTVSGFGVHGSGVYVDPASYPLAFLLGLGERAPLLLMSQWLQVPVDLWAFTPRGLQIASSCVAGGVCAALVAFFVPLLRTSREARFWALGMVLSVVPPCGAFPMDRLLLFVGIGAFGLLACQARSLGLLDTAKANTPERARRAIVVGLLFLHVPIAAVALPVRTLQVRTFFSLLDRIERQIPQDADVRGQTVVLVQGHDLLTGGFVFRRAAVGPLPRRVALLAPVTSPAWVRRPSSDTLVIRSERGWLHESFDCLFRDPALPFSVGQRLETQDVTAEVIEVTADRRPLVVSFRFRVPLEDRSLRWVGFSGKNIVEWKPPAVGAEAYLPTDLWKLLTSP